MDDNSPKSSSNVDSTNLVDFGTVESDALRFQLENFPYVRKSKTLDMRCAVLYIPEDKINEVFKAIGASNLTTYPTILSLCGRRDLGASGVISVQSQPYLRLQGRGTLLGFVDTGIDYTKEAFKYEDGSSRIKWIWDQSLPGKAPDSYNYGSEYSSDEINAALAADDPFEAVPHRDTVGHGTFLASAAGARDSGEYMGASPQSGFIVVKLRKMNEYYLKLGQVIESLDEAYSSNDLMMGIDYILNRARELKMPVSICIGLGSNASSHDGYNYLEEYLSHVAMMPGVAVCCAAGNECMSGRHADGVIAKTEDTFELEVAVGQDAVNGRGFPIHIWNNQTDRLSVSVTSPTGEKTRRFPAATGTTYTTSLIMEPSTIHVDYYFPNPKSGAQFTWIKIFKPTPGIWKITLYGDRILDGGFDAWLPMQGFIEPSIRFVRPSSSRTAVPPATGLGVITVGSYSALSKSLSPFSSWGPTRLPSLAPDLVAPGENVQGIFPDGPGTMSGTSAAAAIAAGACALMLEWGITNDHLSSINTALIKAYLIRGCEIDPSLQVPNEKWGYGMLNLYNTFLNIR
jgi:subtilisin family serine protease